MGGGKSKFAVTNWDVAEGGIKTDKETIDESKPVSEHSIITLNKHASLNQREYDIRDFQGDLLYSTKAVEGTVKWFDLFGKEGQKICRVQTTDMTHKHWDIYRYETPSFEGQEADTEATKKAGGQLYKKARVNITWDRYHGDVLLYGPPNSEQNDATGVLPKDAVLRVEEIQSITGQYQSFIPGKGFLGEPGENSQPLVAYWVWEEAQNTHKIKMHLAKHTDLALHVLLAVLSNMVRKERAAGVAE